MEDHEVVHNIMYNTATNSKVLYKQALKRSEWWDNGVLPLWITAQNQVRDSFVSQQKITTLAFSLEPCALEALQRLPVAGGDSGHHAPLGLSWM